jgi:hypothetical protein
MVMIVSLSVELLPTDDGERPTNPPTPTSQNFKSSQDKSRVVLCSSARARAIDSSMKISQSKQGSNVKGRGIPEMEIRFSSKKSTIRNHAAEDGQGPDEPGAGEARG